ncbi:MAG: DsbA family protein [Nitrososphaeraceae archaeon]
MLVLLGTIAFVLPGSVFANWTIPSTFTLPEQFSTYDGNELKIDYPFSWNVLEESNSVTFTPQNDTTTTIKLSKTPVSSNLISLKSIVDSTLQDLSKNFDNFKLLESNTIPNTQRIPTHQLVYSYDSTDDSQMIQKDFGIIRNDNLYILTLSADGSTYYEYLPIMDRMIASFNQYVGQLAIQKYSPQLIQPVMESVNAIGDSNASITLVEFGDYRCGFCAKFHQESRGQILDNYVDTGKVQLIFKDFVVNDRGGYKGSAQAASASYCAAEQGKYWEYHDAIYDNWKGESNWVNTDLLLTFAENVQIQDIEKFKECLSSDKYSEIVNENNQLARSLGLTGTPSFVVLKDDVAQQIIPGAVPYQVFDATFTALQNN